MVMSTDDVLARGAVLLMSTANAVNFSGAAMFDCAAGRAIETATSAADIAAVKVTRMKASNRIR
jgi:hypothetical protein